MKKNEIQFALFVREEVVAVKGGTFKSRRETCMSLKGKEAIVMWIKTRVIPLSIFSIIGICTVILGTQNNGSPEITLPGRIVFDSDRLTGRLLFMWENGRIKPLVKGREPSFAFKEKKII